MIEMIIMMPWILIMEMDIIMEIAKHHKHESGLS